MAVLIGSSIPAMEVEAYLRGAQDAVRISLDEFKGSWIVLLFYPRDFTFVCPTELQALSEARERFSREGAIVLAASTDSFHSHKAWFETDPRLAGVDYPVIADSSHRLTRALDVLLDDGRALRATFIIDPDGMIRHAALNDLDVGRDIDEIVRTLAALKTGALCPAGWRPGQPTLSSAPEPVSR